MPILNSIYIAKISDSKNEIDFLTYTKFSKIKPGTEFITILTTIDSLPIKIDNTTDEMISHIIHKYYKP
jgi:hypothetical protein